VKENLFSSCSFRGNSVDYGTGGEVPQLTRRVVSKRRKKGGFTAASKYLSNKDPKKDKARDHNPVLGRFLFRPVSRPRVNFTEAPG
jgi:hypothetical protein